MPLNEKGDFVMKLNVVILFFSTVIFLTGLSAAVVLSEDFTAGAPGDYEVNIGGGVYTGGDVCALGNYTFGKSRFFSLNIPACAFRKNEEYPDTWVAKSNYAYLNGSENVNAYAPVYLPQGAIVNRVEFYYRDNSISDVSLSGFLVRRYNFETVTEDMATVSIDTVGFSPDVESIFDLSIGRATIDNQNYSYTVYIAWDPDGATNALRFYGCRIQYAMSTLAP
jgi:hypothetical protein